MSETKQEEQQAVSMDSDDTRSAFIVLKSSDEKDIRIERKSALISKLVAQALENGCFFSSFPIWSFCFLFGNPQKEKFVLSLADTEATEVPIPGVKADILSIVVEYMQHHAGNEPVCIEKPLRSKFMKDVCKDKFDSTFIDTIGDDRQKLYDLILAFNYMDVTSGVCNYLFIFFCEHCANNVCYRFAPWLRESGKVRANLFFCFFCFWAYVAYLSIS